jgi:RNA polymerase subunit RPABC4/transcription elongation factor Spt4
MNLREGSHVCLSCGSTVFPVQKDRGGGAGCLIEIILWFFFIIPGLIYSIWRRADKLTLCPVCSSTQLVPASSSMGQQLRSTLNCRKCGARIEPGVKFCPQCGEPASAPS